MLSIVISPQPLYLQSTAMGPVIQKFNMLDMGMLKKNVLLNTA